MLNIYYGRESVDKEKFIYETIAERGFNAASPVIVLVPDQYTLEAELQAFRITGKNALIGLDVYSISRLGHNVLAEQGLGNISIIDKYGRQMLLTGIMSSLKDDLSVYADNVRKPSFIEMVNDYISQLKQYDVTPDMLAEMADELSDGDVLSMKMKDIVKIYKAYDAGIQGKYTDSEDYVDLFIEKADQSELLRQAKIWVYGFDSFAPKSLKVLGRLMGISKEVNCVLTYDTNSADEDLFSLTGKVIENLKQAAAENGSDVGATQSISGAFPDGRYDITGKNAEISHLEHELFSTSPKAMAKGCPEGITVTEAANYYNEAESAASYILHLVRDKKYRYRDIAVICNDREGLGAALERAFDEYSIPCFMDNKRSISGSGVAVYISALVSACVYGLRTKDIFRALKTGLSVLDQDETEQLENYAICYKIDRNRWSRKFTYGAERYGDDFDNIESSRQKVAALFGKLQRTISRKQTYGEFLMSFYRYLTDDARLVEQLERLMAAQNEAGLRDLAEETMQIWNMIVNILDQINNIMGSEDFDPEEFLQIFNMGLKQAEIGIMPSSPDDLMIGTMQRTRVGKIKALVVVGANEGVIPQGGSSQGLFAEREEELLADRGFEAGKTDQVRREEERLAIYRNFVKPDSELWISYTLADSEGGSIRPSEVIDDIMRIFPYKEIQRDIFNTDKAEDLISGRVSTLRHMTDALVKEKRGTEIDPVWHHVLNWYRENDPETVKSIEAGLGFRNGADEIGKGLSDIMLSGRDHDSLSVSRLENYALCPFAYFVSFGLQPEERRVFEAGSREIGDVYHESLMKITSKLTNEGLWSTITEEEVAKLVRETLEQERKQYGAGLFQYSKGDSYRADRAEQTIRDAVNVLISHARAGKIKDSSYEERFGRGSSIPPVEVSVDGKKVYIEGIIDRLDVLENGRVKIMDYKSGIHELTDSSIRSGYTLQLMVYMKAAQREVREPAGVFYFYLGTKDIDVAGKEDIEIGTAPDIERLAELKDANMKGILINEPETIAEVLGDDESGRIASIKKKKSTGEYSGSSGSTVMNEGDFRDLQDAVDSKVREIAGGITSGKIDIHPMRRKKERLACRNCPYMGICRFDTAFDGCTYNNV